VVAISGYRDRSREMRRRLGKDVGRGMLGLSRDLIRLLALIADHYARPRPQGTDRKSLFLKQAKMSHSFPHTALAPI
jgi:hypothetical protein